MWIIKKTLYYTIFGGSELPRASTNMTDGFYSGAYANPEVNRAGGDAKVTVPVRDDGRQLWEDFR